MFQDENAPEEGGEEAAAPEAAPEEGGEEAAAPAEEAAPEESAE